MTDTQRPGRVTQKRIAELANVSQATVSLVLNGRDLDTSRIPEATRQRVLDVIRDNEYVADPAARRLAGVGNKILGVFTYEPAFPTSNVDFFTPLLQGIEAAAESIGCDLLMFTSTPVVNGRRRLLHEGNRIRLADGCLLLGREMDGDELTRLVAGGFPFVAIGRREQPNVPYVGVDYRTATASLMNDALALGHCRFSYLYIDGAGESLVDRRAGLTDGLAAAPDSELQLVPSTGSDLASDWETIAAFGPTVLVVEGMEHAMEIRRIAEEAGVSVPEQLSMIVLSDSLRDTDSTSEFTRLSPPRTQLGSEAVALLARILDPHDEIGTNELHTLLDCPTIAGNTLAAPYSEAAR